MLKANYFKNTTCPMTQLFIEKTVSVFKKEIKKVEGEVDIIIIDDKEMKRLNLENRGKNKTTDVLSFAFSEDKKIKSDYLGQIFISYPQIKKQAKEYKVKEKEEFIRILTHGLLHLIGYDHNLKVKEQKMFNLQEKIIKKVL
ncbi:MAG: rRNA maturation RNase YbeY [Candidatus Magasanikbacteria bacterium]|nr:rRNA maturation RNase YbeY [Candidatus Magasanikbacteria bacterium]